MLLHILYSSATWFSKAVAHLATYRWYAGEASDFKWFGRGIA